MLLDSFYKLGADTSPAKRRRNDKSSKPWRQFVNRIELMPDEETASDRMSVDFADERGFEAIAGDEMREALRVNFLGS